MKIVRINVSDSIAPFISSYRLHRELLRLGHQDVMFLGQQRRSADDPTVMLFHPPQDLASRAGRFLRNKQIERDFAPYKRSPRARQSGFGDDRSPHGGDVLAQLPDADVIHVHSMHRLIDFRRFFASVPRRTPVVRTLHDMSFFTGGCHLDEGCGRYAEGCGACPQLGSSDPQDLSRQIWLRKSTALEGVDPSRLFIVTPSRWLAEAARQSPLVKRFSVTVIPHGIDTEVFRPFDRRLARERLGIDQDARVVLFVAEGIQRPIKRFSHLVEALNGLRGMSGLLLLTAGSGKPDAQVSIPHQHLGPIRDERRLPLVYSAADVLAVPSLQESFSLVTLESLACGVPVVSSAVGGVREIVRHGVTGLLVPPDDAAALREAIRELLEDPGRREEMAADCRRSAVEEFSVQVMAQRYLGLYERILTGAGRQVLSEANQPRVEQAVRARAPTRAHYAEDGLDLIRRMTGRDGTEQDRDEPDGEVVDRLPRGWRRAWAQLWVPLSGRSPLGKIAARLALWFSPPYKGRAYLARLTPKGFISPHAVVYHRDLHHGKHVLIGDNVLIYQRKASGRIELGDKVRVFDGALLETGDGGRILVGAGSRIHRGCQLVAYKGSIVIGQDVGLAPNCSLFAYNHGVAPDRPVSKQPIQTRGPIVIEDHAWLGVGVIVLDGVRIGTGAVIGAGAVVTQDIPANAIAAGVPARVIAMRTDIAGEPTASPAVTELRGGPREP